MGCRGRWRVPEFGSTRAHDRKPLVFCRSNREAVHGAKSSSLDGSPTINIGLLCYDILKR